MFPLLTKFPLIYYIYPKSWIKSHNISPVVRTFHLTVCKCQFITNFFLGDYLLPETVMAIHYRTL